jgi:hypothetical protein
MGPMADAAERHWQTMVSLFDAKLKTSPLR